MNVILITADVPENCVMSGKQCSPWSDAEFCGIWSGSTQFTQDYLSEY